MPPRATLDRSEQWVGDTSASAELWMRARATMGCYHPHRHKPRAGAGIWERRRVPYFQMANRKSLGNTFLFV